MGRVTVWAFSQDDLAPFRLYLHARVPAVRVPIATLVLMKISWDLTENKFWVVFYLSLLAGSVPQPGQLPHPQLLLPAWKQVCQQGQGMGEPFQHLHRLPWVYAGSEPALCSRWSESSGHSASLHLSAREGIYAVIILQMIPNFEVAEVAAYAKINSPTNLSMFSCKQISLVDQSLWRDRSASTLISPSHNQNLS